MEPNASTFSGEAAGCRSSPRAPLSSATRTGQAGEHLAMMSGGAQYFVPCSCPRGRPFPPWRTPATNREEHADEKEAAEDPLRRLPPLPGRQQSRGTATIAAQALVELLGPDAAGPDRRGSATTAHGTLVGLPEDLRVASGCLNRTHAAGGSVSPAAARSATHQKAFCTTTRAYSQQRRRDADRRAAGWPVHPARFSGSPGDERDSSSSRRTRPSPSRALDHHAERRRVTEHVRVNDVDPSAINALAAMT